MMDELPTCDGCGNECHNASRICRECQTPEPHTAAGLDRDDRKGGRR